MEGGGELVIFEALFKAFPVFSVLETCRVYLLTIDLGIVKCIKKIIKRFFEYCEICRPGPNNVQELAVTKVASPQTSFGVRLSRIHLCVTNEPQRTSAGRL